MGLFDKFKSKSGKPETPKTEEKQVSKPEAAPAPEHHAAVPHGADILVKPLLSEKAMHFAANGRYVFVVNMKARKPEIRKSIQKIYNVHVEDVKIVHLPSKKRRYGRTLGQTSAFKKAIVILKKGEKLLGIVESVG